MKSVTRHPLLQCLTLCIGSALSLPALSADNEALMGLLKVLHDKGTLNDAEYQALLQAAAGDNAKAEQTRQAVAAVNDKVDGLESSQKNAASAAPASSDKLEQMAWASKVRLTGDMRNRFEYIATDGLHDRSRARLRYRLGIIANPLDQLEVGAGLASGSADPRSTNQTFSDAFSSKSINLDYAYTRANTALGAGRLSAIAGKFKFGDFLWTTDDLLWDSDITPEGVSLDYAADNALGKTFANAGVWVLGEFSGSGKDPYMLYGQLGQKFGANSLYTTLAATYYHVSDILPGGSGGLRGGNVGTFSAGTNTDHRFDVLALNGELGSKQLFGGSWAGSLFGSYVNNTDTHSSQDSGLSLGAGLANGPLSLKYVYANLDANAFLDIFPDSDRFGGATDVRSHEIEVAYKLHKNVTLSVDYYHNERKSSGIDQDLLQTDISVKF